MSVTESREQEKGQTTSQTPKTAEEQPSDVSPVNAFMVSQIVEAIKSVGNNMVEYKKASSKANVYPVVLAILVVAAIAILIFFNKITSEAAGFLMGSIVTGTFAIIADIWRRHN